MARHAISGARAHRPRPARTVPSGLVAAALVAAGPGGPVGGSVARLLAPQLRGCVSSRTLETMEAKGLRVHRVGRAAYVHDGHRRNRRVRVAAGLEWADNRLPSWYPEAESELVARSMDADR